MTKRLDEKTKTKLVNYLNSRFGIDKNFFENYIFTITGHSVSIVSFSKENKKIIENLMTTNYVISFGIELFSNHKDFTLSSLGFGIIPAERITQNFVKLNREQANNYLSGKEIETKDIKNKYLMSSGFVACILEKQIIGTAYFNKDKQVIIPNLSFINEKTR